MSPLFVYIITEISMLKSATMFLPCGMISFKPFQFGINQGTIIWAGLGNDQLTQQFICASPILTPSRKPTSEQLQLEGNIR